MGDPVGIAMVGCGQIANAHLKALVALEGARLVHAMDVVADSAKSAAETYGAARWSTSYDDVLADPEVHAIVQCLPHDLHKDFTIRAAQAGKHSLVEKPMALNETEAREMVAAADANGVQLSIGHSTRYMSSFQQAKGFLEEGRIGRVTNVIHQRIFWIEKVSTAWRLDQASCGGLYLPLFGSHDIDAMLWLLEDSPSRVWGSIRCASPVSDGDSDGFIGLDFADGKVASVAFGVRSRQARSEMVLIGTEGTLAVLRNGLMLDGESVEIPGEPGSFQLQMQRFVGALQAGTEVPAPGREVLRVMRTLDLVQESSRLGRGMDF